MLSNIRVVLLNTTHPGNIGAVARAMKTMGLSQLYLVNPQHFPSADATARASGADDLLGNSVVKASLDEALTDCHLVFGASNRDRTIGLPCLDARECARHIRDKTSSGDVAVLFGPEHSGLSNSELDRCHYQIMIPACSDFQSLNLAAAVQVVAYELRMAVLESNVTPPPDARVVVSTAEMERFYQHLEEVMVEIEFLDPGNPRQLMRRLRRLYNRVQPDTNEMNILRGILTAVQRRMAARDKV